MGWGGAGESGDWTVPTSSLVAKQSLSSRSLHPIPCPWPGNSAFACKMNRGKKEKKKKAKGHLLFVKVCLHFYPVAASGTPNYLLPAAVPSPVRGGTWAAASPCQDGAMHGEVAACRSITEPGKTAPSIPLLPSPRQGHGDLWTKPSAVCPTGSRSHSTWAG